MVDLITYLIELNLFFIIMILIVLLETEWLSVETLKEKLWRLKMRQQAKHVDPCTCKLCTDYAKVRQQECNGEIIRGRGRPRKWTL